MSTDIGLQTTSFQVGNRTWHKSRHGIEYKINVTLDVSAFAADRYPNGFIPSGTVLGKITATGLYGPYDGAATDGTETAACLLYADARVVRANGTTATRVGSGGLVRGDVTASKLPFQSGKGSIDTAGRADLPLIRFE